MYTGALNNVKLQLNTPCVFYNMFKVLMDRSLHIYKAYLVTDVRSDSVTMYEVWSSLPNAIIASNINWTANRVVSLEI